MAGAVQLLSFLLPCPLPWKRLGTELQRDNDLTAVRECAGSAVCYNLAFSLKAAVPVRETGLLKVCTTPLRLYHLQGLCLVWPLIAWSRAKPWN